MRAGGAELGGEDGIGREWEIVVSVVSTAGMDSCSEAWRGPVLEDGPGLGFWAGEETDEDGVSTCVNSVKSKPAEEETCKYL